MLKRKKEGLMVIAFVLIVTNATFCEVNSYEFKNYIYLDIIISGGGVRPDYAGYISQYLRPFGVILNSRIVEWTEFINLVINTHDFDLLTIGFSGSSDDPYMIDIYGEEGDLNMFGIDTQMPYGQTNEDLLEQIAELMDFEERQKVVLQWQELIMDKIVPILPLFTYKYRTASWSNLRGYDPVWGIVNSLPYMYFEGLHVNQTSIDKLTLSDYSWKKLDLFDYNYGEDFIEDLIHEKILNYRNFSEPINTGVIKNWEPVSSYPYLIKFTLRENVFWNPSFNITERDQYSSPLDISTTPLMIGFQGISSNGTNCQVTSKDIVFTLLTLSNPFVNEYADNYNWIDDVWIDPYDNLSFYLQIDGNPETVEYNSCPYFWSRLNVNILPEFFLNSTSTNISYSSGGVETVGLFEGIDNTTTWTCYTTSGFGCGKYLLDCHKETEITLLQKSPWWMNVGAKNGETQYLDLNTIIVKVIPDFTVEFDQFFEGKLDLYLSTLLPDYRKTIENDSQFTIYVRLNSGFTFLAYNLRRPFIGGESNYVFLDDEGKQEYTRGIAFRKAINYAINREEMNEKIFSGDNFICESTLSPAFGYWYNDEVVKYTHNTSKAVEWFTAAGYLEEVPTDTSAYLSSLYIVAFLACGCFILKYRRKLNKLK